MPQIDEKTQYLLARLRAESAYKAIGDAQLEKMTAVCMAQDEAYMAQSGVADGEVYDDDAAFAFIRAALVREIAESRAVADAFVDDYLSHNEAYLEEHGQIDWDQ